MSYGDQVSFVGSLTVSMCYRCPESPVVSVGPRDPSDRSEALRRTWEGEDWTQGADDQGTGGKVGLSRWSWAPTNGAGGGDRGWPVLDRRLRSREPADRSGTSGSRTPPYSRGS